MIDFTFARQLVQGQIDLIDLSLRMPTSDRHKSELARLMQRRLNWLTVLAALDAGAAALLAQGWQPMESAPKLQTVLLIMEGVGQQQRLGYQTNNESPMANTWRDPFDGRMIGWPSHWMPLPRVP